MGRLPGGIVDESRDYIIKEVDAMNRSKLLKFSASSQLKSSQGGWRKAWRQTCCAERGLTVHTACMC